MSAADGFEYAQARIQARMGLHPSEPVWRRLAASRTLSAYLEGARATALGPCVADLSGASDVHEIEQSVRSHLHRCVGEVALWAPEPWRVAVQWLNWLPYLPALRHLLEGAEVRSWMGAAAPLKACLEVAPEARPRVLALAGGAVLVNAWERGESMLRAWGVTWRQRWPACTGQCAAGLNGIAAVLERHVSRFPAAGLRESWPARHALNARMRHLFRQHTLEPAAAFAYLALVALDLERLRADLTWRALFPSHGLEP